MLVQPFVNYNIADGWYLTSSPIITADWNARREQGRLDGAGRRRRRPAVPFGKLPINASVQAFDNVEKPEFGADWTLRLQVQFLFPK